MMSLGRQIAVATFGVGAILVATGASGYADAPFVVITATLSPGTTMQFVGTLDGATVTVTCTAFSTSGTVGPPPANPALLTIAPPTISGCTDSVGGTDTITTNNTNGNWKLKAVAPYPATEVKLMIPKRGAKFTTSVLPGCIVKAAPAVAVGVGNPGNYNGAGTLTDTGDAMPVAGSGCAAGPTWAVTATVVFNPNPGAVPPW